MSYRKSDSRVWTVGISGAHSGSVVHAEGDNTMRIIAQSPFDSCCNDIIGDWIGR
jgi:uncharacterized Rossmann fold enzyme